MDINHNRKPTPELQKVIQLLKYKSNIVQVVGTGGLASQLYESDYDLFSNIKTKATPAQAYTMLRTIIERAAINPNLYFIECKIERQDHTQSKFYNPEHLTGAGLFSYIKKGYTAVKNKVSSLLGFPTKLNNTSTKTLHEYGGQQIVSMLVSRTPIPTLIDKAMNILSLGNWQREKDNFGYDKMFHLALIVHLANGKNVVIEKNEVVNISSSYSIKSDTQTTPVPLQGHHITLQQLIDNTRGSITEKQFYDYNALTSNCQNFIANVLRANHIYPPAIEHFVFQDLSELIKHLPSYVSTVAKGITKTGAIVNKIMGKGRPAHNAYDNKQAFIHAFHNVDYLKLDFVWRTGNIFRELSIVYNFNRHQPTVAQVSHSLQRDMHSYIKEKNYYKALKRLFALYKLTHQGTIQIPLSQFFNSAVGKLYQTMTSLQAMVLLLSHDATPAVIQKIKVNMKDLHLVPDPALLEEYIKAYNTLLQKQAKGVWKKIKLNKHNKNLM